MKWLVSNQLLQSALSGCCWICFLWIDGFGGISISTVSLTLFAAFKMSFS